MAFGIDDLIGIGTGIYGAVQAGKQAKRQQQFQDKALGFAEAQYNERAPLRKLGMTQLGQIESPMDLGNLGYNSANPFQAARGPAPSTASYGNWGQYTVDPKTMNPAAPVDPYAAQKDGLRKSKIPVGIQEKMMKAMDAQAASQRGVQPLGGSGYGWER